MLQTGSEIIKKNDATITYFLPIQRHKPATYGNHGWINRCTDKASTQEEIIKKSAPIFGGGGGGRPNFAQGGGTKPEKHKKQLTLLRKQ